jgi:hypothetical protein
MVFGLDFFEAGDKLSRSFYRNIHFITPSTMTMAVAKDLGCVIVNLMNKK